MANFFLVMVNIYQITENIFSPFWLWYFALSLSMRRISAQPRREILGHSCSKNLEEHRLSLGFKVLVVFRAVVSAFLCIVFTYSSP